MQFQVCHGVGPVVVGILDTGLGGQHLAVRRRQGQQPHRDIRDLVLLRGGGRGRGADSHHILGVQGERR